MGFVLLLGGARSGKSALAYRLAAKSRREVTVIATATAEDEEMAARIEHHRSSRPGQWATVEEPVELLRAIDEIDAGRYLVVDCLTLWVANLVGAAETPEQIIERARAVAGVLAAREAVVVTNEVGLGIVPANELARAYRDTLGVVNAELAARADRALLLVAGRTLELAASS